MLLRPIQFQQIQNYSDFGQKDKYYLNSFIVIFMIKKYKYK